MRISTAQIFQQGLLGLQNQQVNIARIQLQLSSGLKNLRPSDDPAEFTRSLELEQIVNVTQQYGDNIDAAESRLNYEETTLNGVNTSLQRVRELAVQGASTILSQAGRNALATEIRERIDEIYSLSNSVDPHDDYIFAGNQGNTLPFTQTAVTDYQVFNFVGDQGVRSMQVSESDTIETSDSGSDVFLKIPSDQAVSGVADLTNTGSAQIAPVFHSDASLVTGNNYRIQFTSATTYDIIDDTTASTLSSGVAYVSGATIEFDGLRTTLTGTPANGDIFRVRDGVYQDVFTTMNKMVLALERGGTTGPELAQLSATMQESIADIDNALDNVN